MRKTYIELAKAKIKDKRNIVISEVKDQSMTESKFTIAQQVIVEDENRLVNIFMKGAFHVEDIQGLYNLRDALNIAIQKANSFEESDLEDLQDFEIEEEVKN